MAANNQLHSSASRRIALSFDNHSRFPKPLSFLIDSAGAPVCVKFALTVAKPLSDPLDSLRCDYSAVPLALRATDPDTAPPHPHLSGDV
jgi:hypothetical protein